MEYKINSKVFGQELNYYLKYYGNEYKEGQGLDIIIDVIKKYSVNGSWIDLGGGSNSPLWRLAFSDLKNMVSVDLNEESFMISELIINNFETSPCYKKVMDFCKCSKLDKNKMQFKYIKSDLLNGLFAFDDKFDNVTQFGLLGLTRSLDDFKRKTNEIIELLNSGGVYIGANWIFSESYSKVKGFSNEFISAKQIYEVAKSINNIKVLCCKEININDDLNYTKVIIYAIKKDFI